MSDFPVGNYERVLIHDNWMALRRFLQKSDLNVRGKHHLARHHLYQVTTQAGCDIALFGTGLGSAQTNWLVEKLSSQGCRVIVKVGTCSALQRNLRDGDVLVPSQALVDEGATGWRRTKKLHDAGRFNTKEKVRNYIKKREYASPDEHLASQLRAFLARKLEIKTVSEDGVWSVDTYGCFDSSPALYGLVADQKYTLSHFQEGSKAIVSLAGVEMECSALFSSSSALDIPAAAVIIVSRSRARLLYLNSNQLPEPGPGDLDLEIRTIRQEPARNESRIRRVERQCIQEVVRFLSEYPVV